MTPPRPRTVFVSHASGDREFVERKILEPLQSAGISTWYAKKDIATAEDWHRTILSGLEQCDRFLVVLSPRAIESEWVRAEVAWAVKHRWPGRIVPVFIEACDSDKVHLWLAQLQSVNFAHDAGDAATRLVLAFQDDRRDDPAPPRKESPIQIPLFHFGGVVPPEYFVGREEQLRQAEWIIRGGQNFLVIGDHRDGKTSLCKMLIHRLMSREHNTVLGVYLNVQLWPNVSMETFLEHTTLGLIGEIARQVFQCKFTSLLALAGKPSTPLSGDDQFQAFVEIYKHTRGRTYSRGGRAPRPFRVDDFQFIHGELLEIIKAKGWSHCVVFYDEANRLTGSIPVEQLVSHEEALAVPGRVSVYAATPAMAQAFGRLKDAFAHEIRLTPFAQDEVKRLLSSYWSRAVGEESDLPVTVDAVRTIWNLTYGQPYRVQLLAGRSFVVANERGDSVVSLDHVIVAADRLRKERPGDFAEHREA